MRCPPCTGTCNQGRTCSALFQHPGSAVVDNGTGLHMPLPDETHDLPIVMFDEGDSPDEVFAEMSGWAVRLMLCIVALLVSALGGLLLGVYVGR